MHKLKLFFSWQSDTKGNHDKIQEALITSCNELREEGSYDIEYDESTWNRSGSPVIDVTVLEKVKSCDLFVADLTPIETSGKKDLPNPNVMYELGVAKGNITDDLILLLYTGGIDTNRMPFDINHQRLTGFSKTRIKDFVAKMAESAVRNPKHASIFDGNDRFLYFNWNVEKNKKTGKYLPGVFLENREVKQQLRDFVAPNTFATLILEKADAIDTYRMNRNRKMRHKEPFEFDVTPYKDFVSEESFPDFYKGAKNFEQYLGSKYDELHPERDRYHLGTSRFGSLMSRMQFVLSKLLLITTSAGQGKTNQICDLVENVLLKRRIPFVYLNGYEIKADSIPDSFADSMLPGHNVSFDDCMKGIVTYCRYKRCPIVLVIDGLNENPEPDVFARHLITFLELVLQYDCVKVVMTCRTEYYKEYYSDIDNAFDGRLVKVEDMNSRLDEELESRLIGNYFHHFNISVKLTKDVQRELCDNLLLLRFFSEAYQGRCLGYVHSINREEVFATYYQKMKQQLIDKVQQEEHYRLADQHVIDFITRILNLMVTNNKFFNVPLSDLMHTFSVEEQRIFSRFLDENILLRKDLAPDSKGPFAHSEVVNFTYDAFRDYLMATYLVDCVFPNDSDQFENLIKDFTCKNHQLKEGLPSFLFVHCKNTKNEAAINVLRTLDWYNEIFEFWIWDVQDDNITDDDLEVSRNILASKEPEYFAKRLLYWGHWDKNRYPNLNLHLLLGFLSTLSDTALESFFEKVWPRKVVRRYWNRDEKSPREDHVLSMKGLLSDKKITNNPEFHCIYELLLYMLPFSGGEAVSVYLDYQKKYRNVEQLDKVGSVCHSTKLKNVIDEIKKLI